MRKRKKKAGHLKNNIRFWKKAEALILCGALFLGMAACGKGDDGLNDDPGKDGSGQKQASETESAVEGQASGGTEKNQAKESNGADPSGQFYQPEEFPLEEGVNYTLYDVQIVNDRLYCMVTDEKNLNNSFLRCLSFTDGSVTDYNTGFIASWSVGEDGSIYMIQNETEGEMGNFQLKRLLVKWDASKQEVYRRDITDLYQPEMTFQYSLAVDSQGRAYLLSDGDICLFDAQGTPAGVIRKKEIQDSNLLYFGRGMDGRVYVTDGGNPAILYAVDYEGAKLKDGLQGMPWGSGRLNFDSEGNFLTADSMGVYCYDIETHENQTLFKMTETQIPSFQISASAGGLSDGRIVVTYSDWESGNCGVVLMSVSDEPREASNGQKEELTIGMLHSFPGLEAAVSQFNRQNENCHITVKTYLDEKEYDLDTGWERIQADIAIGNCPDILGLDSYSMDWRNLTEKGVLEDLAPFLEKSAVLPKEDLIENVLSQFTHNGKLTVLPTVLQLQTYVGSGDALGDVDSWTAEDVIAFADAHPDAFLLDYFSPGRCLRYCLQYTMDSFVQEDTGKCSFDNEKFRNILKFAAKASEGQKRYEAESKSKSWRQMAQEGELLLVYADMYDVYGPQMFADPFGSNPVFVGLPSSDGAGVGTFMATECFGISAQSQNKEAAWNFLESYISGKQEKDGGMAGFPILRSRLDAMLEAALSDYLLDEDGNPVTDQFGDYVPKSSGTISFSNTYSYSTHVVKQEEADVIRNIIEHGRLQERSTPILDIIVEETKAYFDGQKSLDDVIGVIQNRVQLYLDENM